MPQPGVSTTTSQRMDRLLRSLVGVSDVRVAGSASAPRGIHVLRAEAAPTYQIVRNVVSGLHAVFGIAVQQEQVLVYDDRASFDAAVAAIPAPPAPVSTNTDSAPADPPAAAKPAQPKPSKRSHPKPVTVKPTYAKPSSAAAPARPAASEKSSNPGATVPTNGSSNVHYHANGNGNGNGHANGNGHGAHNGGLRVRGEMPDDAQRVMQAMVTGAAGEAALQAMAMVRDATVADRLSGVVLERLDVDRHNRKVRCHTVLSVLGRSYSAIAEAPDGPVVEAELAARVVLDALRAGAFTGALLEGVGFISIAGTSYCVATVREAGRPAPRAGTAPMTDSMAAAATAAVLTAIGTYTDARVPGRPRA